MVQESHHVVTPNPILAAINANCVRARGTSIYYIKADAWLIRKAGDGEIAERYRGCLLDFAIGQLPLHHCQLSAHDYVLEIAESEDRYCSNCHHDSCDSIHRVARAVRQLERC